MTNFIKNSPFTDHEELGTLFLVSTPIGNLEDISKRAIDTLINSDFIFAEDTRTFKKIANRYGVKTPTRSYHNANESRTALKVIELLKDGKNISLVSEAGTPLISDPGYVIVSSCREEEIPVTIIPGANAAISALAISGFEPQPFSFIGFLSQKGGKREKALNFAVESESTTIFYESPHRILKTLGFLAEQHPEKEIFIARELTKIHEESLRGPARDVFADLSSRSAIKGEFVLIIRGNRS